MSVRNSPTVRRRRLGLELRRLREAAGMTCEQAGDHLDCSASKISRLETARVPARALDVQALCGLYRVDDEQTQHLVALARESKHRGWWQRFDDVVPDWFETYVGLETVAASIRTYEIQLIPGLLQTEGYARALFAHADITTPEAVERSVTIRQERQAILHAENPPHYWAIICESALHRMIGGPGVMRDQLIQLIEFTELRNVTVQIIPHAAGAHPAMMTPFVVLSFPDRTDGEVVFLDYLTGALYLEKPDEVDRYTQAFNHLVAVAAAPQVSADLIRRRAKEIQRHGPVE